VDEKKMNAGLLNKFKTSWKKKNEIIQGKSTTFSHLMENDPPLPLSWAKYIQSVRPYPIYRITFKYHFIIFTRLLTDGLSTLRFLAEIVYAFLASLKCSNLFLYVPSNITEFLNLLLTVVMSNTRIAKFLMLTFSSAVTLNGKTKFHTEKLPNT
jgi:hypothetical protein